MGNSIGRAICGLAAIALLAGIAAPAGAANGSNQFGGQSRADAASEMIVLGVQQGISSLPPTSGQAFTYDYNAELGTFVASEQLGPTVLRSPQTIGANRFSVRVAASYFDLSKTFDPIPYRIQVPPNPMFPSPIFAQFGMSANANVSLLNFAATYGITDRIEVTVNVPVSVVQAQAYQLYTVQPGMLSRPPSQRQLGVLDLGPIPTQQQIHDGFSAALGPNCGTNCLSIGRSSFSSLGFDFNSGTQSGVGRISVGGKGILYDNDQLSVAFAPEFFCNSPNQAQFAGSNSPSILPRVIGQWKVAKYLHAHTDVGYEYDFDVQQLSRFVWNSGISLPLPGVTFDSGVGGSKFDKAIQWTPARTFGTGPKEPGYPNGLPATLMAVNPSATELGTNYVDFLFGVKVR